MNEAKRTVEANAIEGSPPDASPVLGEPVSYLSGDRFCAQCNHNLVGQPVYREQAYGIIIARCPECGRFASLNEYPSLGRWGRRLGAFLAAMVILLVLLFMAGSAGVLAGVGYGLGLTGQSRVESVVRIRVQEFAEQPQAWWRDPAIYEAWVAETGGIPTVVAELGGWPLALSLEVIPVGVGFAFAALVFAGLIAVMVPGQRGLKLVMIAMIPPTLSLLYLTPWWWVVLGSETRFRGITRLVHDVELHVAIPTFFAGWLLLLVPATVAGALLGRSVARGIVCMILPKRHRVALSFLWHCDGRRPPAVR